MSQVNVLRGGKTVGIIESGQRGTDAAESIVVKCIEGPVYRLGILNLEPGTMQEQPKHILEAISHCYCAL